jgi:hypothetical protein
MGNLKLPAKPKLELLKESSVRRYQRGLIDESGGYNTHCALRNMGRDVEKHMWDRRSADA